ncbi:MAG: hypothetical protein ABIQ32_03210 [Sphingomicrobium sp.]
MLALSPISPAVAAPLIGLPVGPGEQGKGPYEVESWPDGGCSKCTVNATDLAVFQNLLSALSGEAPPTSDQMKLPVHAIRVDHGVVRPDVRLSFADLKKRVADCELESTGILSPNSAKIVAFGVQITCGKGQSKFLSVVMDAQHAPTTVYWMPDGPIYAMTLR